MLWSAYHAPFSAQHLETGIRCVERFLSLLTL